VFFATEHVPYLCSTKPYNSKLLSTELDLTSALHNCRPFLLAGIATVEVHHFQVLKFSAPSTLNSAFIVAAD